MNFIIPKNYTFKPKLLGLIDYQTALLDSIWAGLLFGFVQLFFTSLSTKLYIFVALFVPFFLFSIVGVHNENILSVILYLSKYYYHQKIYLFKKRSVRTNLEKVFRFFETLFWMSFSIYLCKKNFFLTPTSPSWAKIFSSIVNSKS